MMTTAKRQLSFIFTAHGFSTDEAGKAELSPEDRKWKKQFDEDRWKALYFLGFEKISTGSPSFLFLHRLAAAFVNVLLTSPLFPFLKGKMDVSIPEEDVEKILQATAQQKPQRIGWEHNDAGTEHRFVVVNIPRETFGTDLHLTWDAKSLNAQGDNLNGSHDFKIPSQASFGITRMEGVKEESRAFQQLVIITGEGN